MPRRKNFDRIPTKPDPVWGDVVVGRFINCMMLRGKKNTAERIFYAAMENTAKKAAKEGVELFEQVMRNVKPLIEVKPRRVGGATYQVPVEVKGERGVALATRWLITHARKRTGKSMVDRLSAELLDAFNNTGASVKKREETHKMAEANRAFAHYRY